MFDTLADRFDGIFTKLRSRGKLTDKDIDEVCRELRVALLEADVNVVVARNFIRRVKERAQGAEVAKSLSPAQQVIKIVHEELVETLGGTTGKLTTTSKPPTVVMMAGLQGSGKTTASAKLARLLKSQSRRPLLVGADLQRPAAVEQLRVLGERIGVPVYSEPTDPVSVARGRARGSGPARPRRRDRRHRRPAADRRRADGRAAPGARRRAAQRHAARRRRHDRPGSGERRHRVRRGGRPHGVILTKIDGDARGGAALSVKEVVGKPILFAGTGEKLDEFEPFHPDRMASRILGMGDVLTLIEKAEATFDQEEMEKAEEKLRKGQLTLEDFLDQMRQVQQDGPAAERARDAPGHAQGDQERGDRRQGDQPDRGDHLLDDAGRAARPVGDQRLPPRAHRRGQRRHARRRQRAC